MESYLFNPDLNNNEKYTPLSEIQPLNYYNIAGVLVDFQNSFQIGQKFSFKLMDSSGKIEVSYFINEKGSLCPSFSQNYQLILIHNIQFVVGESETLIGLLNGKSHFKILTNSDITRYPKYMMLISKVKDDHKPNSSSPSKNAEIQPELKKMKYNDHIEATQHSNPPSNQSQAILESSLIVSSRNALREMSNSFRSLSNYRLLNSLADIQPGRTFQIIAQVLKLERNYYNRDEYIITDYSCGNNLSSYSVELPNSKILYGNYFLKLTAWDDQRKNIEESKFYHFSMVRTKMDKMGQIELNINGTRPNMISNATTPLSINQVECQDIKERMNIVANNNVNNPTKPTSSNEVVRESKFCLVQNLQTKDYYDMTLLILKKFDTCVSGKLTLLCTDFTSNPMLKYHQYTDNRSIVLDPNMCVHLTCWDDAASLMEDIIDNNPSHSILQFRSIRAEMNHRHGIELHLRSNAVILDENKKKVLEFDPIPNKDNFYYKELIKRHQDHSNQFNPQAQSMVNSSKRFMDDEEFQNEPDLNQVEEENSSYNIVINDLGKLRSYKTGNVDSVQRIQSPKDNIPKNPASNANDVRTEGIVIEDLPVQNKNEELVKYTVKLVHVEPRNTDKLLRFICISGCWKSESLSEESSTENDISTWEYNGQNNTCKKCSKEMELTLTMLFTCQLMNVKPKQTINFIVSHELSKKILNVELDSKDIKEKKFHDEVRKKLCELALKPFDVYSLPVPFFQQENTKVYQIRKLVRHG